MTRRQVHALFALATFAAATLLAVQAWRLVQAQRLAVAIEAAASPAAGKTAAAANDAAASVAPAASAASTGASVAAASAPPPPVDDPWRDAPPEVRLARASALARAGANDAAVRLYSGLIEPGRLDAVGRLALYDLGNLYLRQGLAVAAADPAQAAAAAPLVELAKQRYRDLLRVEPGDWDARHNLERALRLAPEEQAPVVETDNVPVERRQVQLRGMTPGDLP